MQDAVKQRLENRKPAAPKLPLFHRATLALSAAHADAQTARDLTQELLQVRTVNMVQ